MTSAVLESELEARFNEGPGKTLGTMFEFLVVPGFTTTRLIQHYKHRDAALKDPNYRAFFESATGDIEEWNDSMRRSMFLTGAIVSDLSKVAVLAALAIPETLVRYI